MHDFRTAKTTDCSTKEVATPVATNRDHPAQKLVKKMKKVYSEKKNLRDSLKSRLDNVIQKMTRLRIDGETKLDKLNTNDIQNLATHTVRQLRQFALFLRSESVILTTMPSLLFQRCTHCVDSSAPEITGT